MRGLRIIAVMIILSAVVAFCGCGSRHSDYGGQSAGEIKIKGQVDGGVESSRGLSGKND